MGEGSPTNPLLWIPEANERATAPKGQHESLARAWKRLWSYAVHELRDTAAADETMDQVAKSVAKVGERSSIRRPDAYVATAVVRKVRKLVAKEKVVEYAGSSHDLAARRSIPEKDSVKELENRIFMGEFLASMDEESRVICEMWLSGDEWKDIASDVGCSVQHAKDKLRHAIESTKKRLLGPGSSKP